VIYEWDAEKAKGNLRKHRISFEDAATVFLDPLALTFPDPDHSRGRIERSQSAVPADSRLYSCRIASAGTASESSARGRRPEESIGNMKKASAKGIDDDLRPEYDLSQLKGGVRGKYYLQATAGTNLVLIERELADVFPDSESVNRALRLLVNTAAAAAGTARRRPGASNNRPKSAAGKGGRLAARR